MIPRIKHILYASDLSENSIPALEWALMMSHQHDARITFLHVIEEVSPHATAAIQSFMGEEKWKKMTEEWNNEANSQIEARIQRFCDQVSDGMTACPAVPQETVITRGVPFESILQEAEIRNCDLIVMGTHGAGVFESAVIGSTARRVVRRSEIPVLVIPLGSVKSESDGVIDPVI